MSKKNRQNINIVMAISEAVYVQKYGRLSISPFTPDSSSEWDVISQQSSLAYRIIFKKDKEGLHPGTLENIGVSM